MTAAMLRLALYQPDIPQNTGTIVRLCACLGVGIDLIEPAAFDLSDRNFRRAGMDYVERAAIARHDGFAAFEGWRRAERRRLVLVETDGTERHDRFAFGEEDVLLLGRESAGVPASVYYAADASVRIPMRPGLRSINVALAAAIVLAEALRQLDRFPGDSP